MCKVIHTLFIPVTENGCVFPHSHLWVPFQWYYDTPVNMQHEPSCCASPLWVLGCWGGGWESKAHCGRAAELFMRLPQSCLPAFCSAVHLPRVWMNNLCLSRPPNLKWRCSLLTIATFIYWFIYSLEPSQVLQLHRNHNNSPKQPTRGDFTVF